MITDINNETDFVLDDRCTAEIENVARQTLESEAFHHASEIAVLITDNDKIRALNKKYRRLDAETDVLSFPAHNLTPGAYDNIEDTPVYLGDIVVSIEKAITQSEEYGHSLLREISFLTVHSVLHLLGYDHLTEQESEIMFQKQEDILKKAGIPR